MFSRRSKIDACSARVSHVIRKSRSKRSETAVSHNNRALDNACVVAARAHHAFAASRTSPLPSVLCALCVLCGESRPASILIQPPHKLIVMRRQQRRRRVIAQLRSIRRQIRPQCRLRMPVEKSDVRLPARLCRPRRMPSINPVRDVRMRIDAVSVIHENRRRRIRNRRDLPDHVVVILARKQHLTRIPRESTRDLSVQSV